ncbi:MAG TPA: hypothetical protein VFA32_11380 [Dehalococcoidia bacterium]|nr:hypothetical protein [Dehalococcoidia bacterium]
MKITGTASASGAQKIHPVAAWNTPLQWHWLVYRLQNFLCPVWVHNIPPPGTEQPRTQDVILFQIIKA